MPRSVACCFLTVSLCLTALTAFCRSSCGSSCNFSDKSVSLIPTTIRSRISSSWSCPNAQCSASPYNEVMNESADSPSSCLRELNFSLSKISNVSTAHEMSLKTFHYYLVVFYFFFAQVKRLEDVLCPFSHCIQ